MVHVCKSWSGSYKDSSYRNTLASKLPYRAYIRLLDPRTAHLNALLNQLFIIKLFVVPDVPLVTFHSTAEVGHVNSTSVL